MRPTDKVSNARRAWMRERMIPSLMPGTFLPPSWWIAEQISVDRRAAMRMLHRELDAAGVAVSRGYGRDSRRLYVRFSPVSTLSP